MAKRIFIAIFIFYHLAGLSQMSFGNPEKLNSAWKFNLQDNEDFKATTYVDTEWETIDVPHDWSVKGQLDSTLASCTGYLPGGVGWYRKIIDVPIVKQGQKVYLYFEGVYNRSEVFLNGTLIGSRPNGYISFAFDATPYIKFGGKNTIAVRVDHSRSADSRWYTGSGIYRNVWLVYANPIHIAQWGVYAYPEIDKDNGILKVEVEVENGSKNLAVLTVLNELIDSEGTTVTRSFENIEVEANKAAKIPTRLTVNNPELWDLENPYLYILKTTILKDGRQIDQSSTQTGFRQFTFDSNKGFALNGTWMKLKGVCLHHDSGVLGSAFYSEVWKTRLATLKKIGVNAIRTSHNPQAPDFYKLCDELGLLVLNEAYDEWEFPKRKWLEGWNVGTPGYQGSFDIFADWSEKDLEDMVRRDRNHMSIFAWSIGNEVDYPNDPYSHPVLDGGGDTGFSQPVYGGYKKDAPNAIRLGAIAKRLVVAVKRYDQSRPTTAGLAGVAMSNSTEYPGALDIAGYNYTENKYISDHKNYPDRVIFGSETRHDYKAWLAVTNNEYIFGQFLWTGMDYLGESREWPSRGFYSGLVDFMGRIKPMGYYRQSLWSKTPMIYIGTYMANKKYGNEYYIDAWPNWNYKEGEMIRIVCYTNAAKARLELNGKVIGEEQLYNDQTGIISWEVPFHSGTLEAIGLNDANEEVSRYTVVSAKEPHALTAETKSNNIDNNNGVALIVVNVVDENGIAVNLADSEVTCTISGPGELLGLEAGNNTDMSDYTDSSQHVFQGKILAYIKATGAEGTITVKFSSPGLKTVEKTLVIK